MASKLTDQDDQRPDRESNRTVRNRIVLRPRFSVKDLLLATTLIAAGSAMLYQVLNYDPRIRKLPVGLDYMLAYGGAAVIGAGIFTPFKRPLIGAIAGIIALVVIIQLT
jgi:hypothetical protein